MVDQNASDKRQKLIDDAVAQCQKTREVLEKKMPFQFDKIRTAIKDASQEVNIRSGIANLKSEGEEKAHVVETVQKYLELSSANSVFKQSIKTLLHRHKH